MRERLVSLSHTVNFFTLLNRTAATFGSIDQLTSQTHTHRLLTTLASSFAQPAHRQCHTTGKTNFDRNLVVCTTNTTALHFDLWLGIGNCQIENLNRIFTSLLTNLFERAVQDAFSNGLLTSRHQHVYELGQILIAELWIRQDFTFGYFSASWHINLE